MNKQTTRINRYNPETMRGWQPVRVLQWNVALQFEKVNPNFTTQIIARHRVSPGIGYDDSKRPIIYGGEIHGPFIEEIFTLASDDVVDPAALLKALRLRTDPVSQYLYTRLGFASRWDVDHRSDTSLSQSVLAGLNKIIVSNDVIFDQSRFAQVRLSDSCSRLLECSPWKPHELRRLNRLLLEDAYPNQLARVHTKQISIQETFLSFLWIMCYSHVIMLEEANLKPALNRLFGQGHEPDTFALTKAYQLHRYGMMLLTQYKKWDVMALPNPETYELADATYIEKANGIFTYAMAFILTHEVGHATCGHFERSVVEEQNATTFDKVTDECAADGYAIDQALHETNTKARRTAECGLLMAFCSLLLLRAVVRGRTHPDADDRITEVLKALKLEDTDPLWGIATLSLKLWDNAYTKRIIWPSQGATWKSLFYEIVGQVKRL